MSETWERLQEELRRWAHDMYVAHREERKRETFRVLRELEKNDGWTRRDSLRSLRNDIRRVFLWPEEAEEVQRWLEEADAWEAKIDRVAHELKTLPEEERERRLKQMEKAGELDVVDIGFVRRQITVRRRSNASRGR